MKKTVLILMILLLGIIEPGFTKNMWNLFDGKMEEGSGNLETIVIDLDDFHRIKSNGSQDIFIEIGPQQKVTLTIDDNLLDNIITEVRGGTLYIDSKGSYSSKHNGKIDITVPNIDKITLSGSGDIEIIKLDNAHFEYHLSGSGSLRAEGKVEELEVAISGSGEVDTQELIAQDVFVEISGSGNARVHATDIFDGSVSGSGDIYYYGNPKDISTSVSGSGKIRKK